MKTQDLNQKIVSLGKEKDFKKLRAVLEQEDHNVIQKLVCDKLGHIDAFQILNYTFMALSHSGTSQVKRTKIIQAVLETMPEKEMSTVEANKIIHRLSREMIKLNSSHMMRLSQWCVDSIQKSEQKYMLWKVLLPNLLNVLSKLDEVEHSGTKMNGAEYRRQVINSLCMMTWDCNLITPLADMFIDMELAPDEHLQVTYKLCQGMEKLDPSSIPPLVHQLLLLTVHQHSLPVFLHLQEYFTRCLYDRIRTGAQESSSQDFISEDIMSGKRHELMQAESTILFYINQSANVGNANIRDLLNNLKNTITAPEFCLNPFFMTVLLSLSFVSCYEDQVFDIVRSAFARVLAEEKRKEVSAWLQDVYPNSFDLERLISQIIESSGRERALIREGFMKIALALLQATGPQSKEGHGRQVWKYGRLILVRLVRKHFDVAPVVVEHLCNHIIRGSNVTQYADTLLKLSAGSPLMLNECQTAVKQLIEQLLQLPGSVSQQAVVSVMPLARSFPSIRDCLMLVLRKAVYSCNLNVRVMAVKGFLLLLKTLDTKSLTIASTQSTQHSESTSSTQVHSEPIEGGEGVGMEVIGVLRRCVTQQQEVRSVLYSGIFDAVSKNHVLIPYVLDFLLGVLKDYYISDEIVQPPFNFEKTIYVKEMDVMLMEPIGQLVFVIQQFVTRFITSEELENNKSLKNLQEILDILCKRMTMCTLEKLGLEEGLNLNDILPESRRLNEIYHQALGIYEALMVYTSAVWSLDSKVRHQELNSLFRCYSKLIDFGKNASKSGKTMEKTSRAQKNKSVNKTDGKTAMKVKLIGTKKTATILDIKSVVLMMQAFFQESVPWASEDDLKHLRCRREFCRYVLQVTLQILQRIHTTKYADLQIESGLFKYCSKIGSIIYQRFLYLNDEDSSVEDDPQVMVLAVECWNELLASVFIHFESQLPQLLEDIGGVEFSKGLGEQLLIPIKSIQKRLIESLEEDRDTDTDPVLKKLPLLYANVLSQLVSHLPRNSPVAKKVFSWLKKFVNDKTIYNVPVVKEIFSLLFKLQIRHKVESALLDNIALQLLSLMESIDTENPPDPVPRFSILTEATQVVCLQQVCVAVKHMLENIDWMIARSRGMFAARAYPSSQTPEQKSEQLSKQERDICSHASHCVKVVTVLVRIALPEGPAIDAVLRTLMNTYNTTSNIAKYFCNRSSKSDLAFQAARFPHVIHLTAVELAQQVHWLLLHVMGDTEEEEEERKKSKKGNKLKVSRDIKDTKLVPRIVYGMEMFEKNVILLSKKCNVKLMERVKVHAGRDFRIKMDVVKSSLKNQEENDDDEDQQGEEECDEAEVQKETENNGENKDESSGEDEQPARKKKK